MDAGAMWLRHDWAKHLSMAHEMGGFHYVRGHGMLDEDVQCYSTGQTYYNAIRAYSNVVTTQIWTANMECGQTLWPCSPRSVVK